MIHQRKISVTGLGYVGLSIAAALGKIDRVIGYDISSQRITELQNGTFDYDTVLNESIKNTNIHYTLNPDDLKAADFHIITVQTPIDHNKLPDFSALLAATATVGKRLKKGDIVVYESTVYPGATEEKCIPLLQQVSGLQCGSDFNVGYSPERINPGDAEHTFSNIIKIISATSNDALSVLAQVYKSVVPAGVYPVSSIRVAEAAKVIENTQRDVNISLMNEIALILHNIGMDTTEVIAATKTKWNYLPFYPGLVGGHCIGVNSYYLTYKSQELGYYPEVINAARRVNEYIPKFIAEHTVRKLINSGCKISEARVAVLGVTYKENCSDVHDTKVINLINELTAYGIHVLVHDPIANQKDVMQLFKINLTKWDKLINLNAIIIAVADKEYIKLDVQQFARMLAPKGVIMDIKGIIDVKKIQNLGITVWSL